MTFANIDEFLNVCINSICFQRVFPDCWHEIQDFCKFAKSAINQFHFIKKKNKYKVDATERKNTAIG